ncbi:MAG: aminotransferase class I/II-fold pyridoxal phosphate-dependent enzyme [Propionibacteriaceae bacterium]|nr:aminotransferase class I/II-fold pyridoxal phosphate-dependent enzyme [Propionibacteriaceae bacterium]
MSTFSERIDALTIDDLLAAGSLKWTAFPGCLGAWVAESDFGTAPEIETALRQAATQRLLGYVPLQLRALVKQSAAEYQLRRYGWNISAAQVFTLPDVLAGITDVMTHFMQRNSKVIVPTPNYMPFLQLPEVHHREIIQLPMRRTDNGFHLDLADLNSAFQAGGELLVICNPHNPIGKVYTRRELESICEVVAANGGQVFSDEIHAPLIYPGATHIPYASINDTAAHHTITAFSASKAFNTAGLKCAQMVLSNPEQQQWAIIRDLEHEPSVLGVLANIAAYRESDAWLAEELEYLDGNRHLVLDLITTELPNAQMLLPQATYLAWVDLSAYQLGDRPADWLREHAAVALTDGSDCGDIGRGSIRLNFATPRPILATILKRIIDAVKAA